MHGLVRIERRRIVLVFLSSLPLLVGLLIANAVKGTGFIMVNVTVSYTLLDMVVQAIVSTVLGVAVVGSLFWLLQRQGRGARRLMVAFFISPMLFFVSIFLGQAFLLVLFKGSASLFEGLLLLVSLGVSMLSIALVLIDAIPPVLRNGFVAFYGGIFGTFMGITFITTSMVVVILSLIVEDYSLTKFAPAVQVVSMTDRIGSDPFDYTRIQSESVAVGVGDYVAYSLIGAHALIFFPPHVWIMSVLLAVLGILVNAFVLAPDEGILPAIPLPAALAVFPWIVHMATLAVFAG